MQNSTTRTAAVAASSREAASISSEIRGAVVYPTENVWISIILMLIFMLRQHRYYSSTG